MLLCSMSFMLSVTYAECRKKYFMLSVILLNVVILSETSEINQTVVDYIKH